MLVAGVQVQCKCTRLAAASQSALPVAAESTIAKPKPCIPLSKSFQVIHNKEDAGWGPNAVFR